MRNAITEIDTLQNEVIFGQKIAHVLHKNKKNRHPYKVVVVNHSFNPLVNLTAVRQISKMYF